MATLYNPSIVRSNLILLLDAANSRSYPGSGTTWTDLSGNNNHFTLYNTTFSSNFIQFSSTGVDATSSYAENTNRNWIPQEFTICIFAKDWTSGMLASSLMYFGPDHDGWRLETDAARTWHNSFPENANSWGTYTAGNWNMFSYSHSATGTYSSINGSIINSTVANRTFDNTYSTIMLGRYTLQTWNTGGYLNGKIGAVLAYDKSLSSDELVKVFSAYKGRYLL